MSNIKVQINPKNEIQVRAMTLGSGVTLSSLTDVDLTGVLDGYTLVYDADDQIFRTAAAASGGSNVALTDQSNVFTASQQFNSDVVIGGNLTINGTTTVINATNLAIADKKIELARNATTDLEADGGGISLKGASNKELVWSAANNSWTSTESLDLASGKNFKIDGATVLTSTGLGIGVLTSSLTSVGTIGAGIWRASPVELVYGGTGNALVATPGAIAISSNSGIVFSSVGQAGQLLISSGTDAPVWASSVELSSLGISSKSTIAHYELITSSSVQQTIVNLSQTQYRSAKFVIQATNSVTGAQQSTEIMAIHNDSTAAHVEYATISIGGAVATFDVVYSAGISLICVPSSSDSTVFRVFSIAQKI